MLYCRWYPNIGGEFHGETIVDGSGDGGGVGSIAGATHMSASDDESESGFGAGAAHCDVVDSMFC